MAQQEQTVTTPEEVDVTTQEAAEEVAEEITATESTEEATAKPVEAQIDYNAVIEEERSRREKAEKALAEKAFKQREEKREETTEVDEDAPLTRREFLALMQEQQQEATKSAQESAIKSEISKYTGSEEEAEAAYLMYQNRIVPTGDNEADALAAIGILNAKRNVALQSELKRSLAGKDTVSTSNEADMREDAGRPEPKLSSADAAAIKSVGFEFDSRKGLYKKAIAGGKKFMYYDPKRPEGQKRWTA